jgi:hypothetical protein
MAYCAISDVKAVLDITAAVVTYDSELTACVVSADAIVDSLLEPHNLSVPASVPQNIEDASAHYAAWLFRRRRDPKGAAAFKLEAEVFLQAYIDSASELAFKVVSDQ